MFKYYFLILFGTLPVFAQIPQVGESVDFAGVTVRLDAERRDLVQAQINTLLGGSRSKLYEKLERIQLFFPIIVPILEDEGVPNDFKYLAVVESSFLPDAVSTSNAVGYWQMKSGTATDLNLRVDYAVDERKNIFSSTVGAAIYLKQINELYKNWISAMAGYRIGRNGVASQLPSSWKFAREIDLRDMPDPYLIKALAHKVAFDAVVPQLPNLTMALVEYKNGKGKTLRKIAEELKLPEEEVKAYNSWLQFPTIPQDKDYSVLLYVPVSTANAIRNGMLLDNNLPKSDIGFPILQRITYITKNQNDPIFYTINGKKGIQAQEGDTYEAVAKRAKIKPDDFLEYNDLNDRDLMTTGEVYYLEKKDKKAPIPVHIVREGETLRDISHIYGVRLERLLKYNHMDNVQRLQVGRVISLQGKHASNTPEIVVEEKSKEPKEEPKKPKPEEKKEEKQPQKPVIVVEPPKKDLPKTEETVVVVIDNPAASTPNPATEQPRNDTPRTVSPRDDADEIIILDGKPVRKSDLNKINNGGTVREERQPTVIVDSRPRQPELVNPFPDVTVKPVLEERPANTITHVVKEGENYFSIARLYRVTPTQLYDWNALAPDIVLFKGQELVILRNAPASTNPTTRPERPTTPRETAGWRYHTVKTGENLFRIALNNRVTVEDLRAWNNLQNNAIEIGQQLKIKK